MILMLCNRNDVEAAAFAPYLRCESQADVHVIAAEELVFATEWTQRIEQDCFSASFNNARLGRIDESMISGVINRVTRLPETHLRNVVPEDRDYIRQELLAVATSWLAGLDCPVVPRPTAVSLSGPQFHPFVWAYYAIDSGFAPVEKKSCSHQLDCRDYGNTIVVGERVFGSAVPESIGRACIRLARFCGYSVLQIQWARLRGEYVFLGADSKVDFSIGGRPLARAMADLLAIRR